MAAFWPIVLVSAHVAAGQVPKLNITPTCRAAEVTSAIKRPQGACESDEKQARTTLEKNWRTYSSAERQRCTELTQMGGPPSYVELLTCLQTAQEAAKLPNNGGLGAPAD